MGNKIIKSKAVITADMLSSADTTVDELLSKDVCEEIEEMAIRDKLIDVLLKAHRECIFLEQEQPYPCEGCKYCTIDRSIRGCIFDRYADAIIESGIFCDNSKLPKDSVVLTNDNAEELANLIVTSPQMQSVMSDLIKAWQKETAKDICFKIIKDLPQPLQEKWKEFFAKEYGVEIKG